LHQAVECANSTVVFQLNFSKTDLYFDFRKSPIPETLTLEIQHDELWKKDLTDGKGNQKHHFQKTEIKLK
jgi:hypothetical protein